MVWLIVQKTYSAQPFKRFLCLSIPFHINLCVSAMNPQRVLEQVLGSTQLTWGHWIHFTGVSLVNVTWKSPEDSLTAPHYKGRMMEVGKVCFRNLFTTTDALTEESPVKFLKNPGAVCNLLPYLCLHSSNLHIYFALENICSYKKNFNKEN